MPIVCPPVEQREMAAEERSVEVDAETAERRLPYAHPVVYEEAEDLHLGVRQRRSRAGHFSKEPIAAMATTFGAIRGG